MNEISSSMTQSKIFCASIDQLPEMMSFIREAARPVGFDSFDLNKIEVASEEAIVNVIDHSYLGRGGEIEISLLSEKKKWIQITISDIGEPFNPLVQELQKDLSSPLEKRPLGGLGIFFIRRCLDKVHYQ